jgi:hypothetical protein
MGLSRRSFLAAAAVIPAGCALRAHSTGDAPAPPAATVVRAPAPGQRWRYQTSDGLSGAVLAVLDESVMSVGTEVVIERRLEAAAPAAAGSGWASALRDFFEHQPPPPQSLAAEVQQPWGRVALDPHWDLPQIYEDPVPLWPTELRPGWNRIFITRYKVAAESRSLTWQQSMRADRWERVAVPGGTFTALRYTNHIVFTHLDWARANCTREETVWIAPEVGRWVRRMSSGSYYISDTIDSTPYVEDSRTWELLDWA